MRLSPSCTLSSRGVEGSYSTENVEENMVCIRGTYRNEGAEHNTRGGVIKVVLKRNEVRRVGGGGC